MVFLSMHKGHCYQSTLTHKQIPLILPNRGHKTRNFMIKNGLRQLLLGINWGLIQNKLYKQG